MQIPDHTVDVCNLIILLTYFYFSFQNFLVARNCMCWCVLAFILNVGHIIIIMYEYISGTSFC